MNTFLGVSETLSVNEVDDRAIVDSDWVYLEGYLVSSPTGLAAALHTRAVAEANGVKDLGQLFRSRHGPVFQG